MMMSKTETKKRTTKQTETKESPVTKKTVKPEIGTIFPEPVEPRVVPKIIEDSPNLPKPGEYLKEAGFLGLFDEFNQENIMPLVAQIMDFNHWPLHQQPEVIQLHINSPGGSVASALHLIDIMKMSRIPVSTTAFGLAASCGVLTLMAGEKGMRYATHNTSIMSHQYAAGSRGKEHELMGIVKEFELTSERLLDHYQKCTGKSRAYIKKNLLGPTDVWMTAEEAKKHGIIDEVIYTY